MACCCGDFAGAASGQFNDKRARKELAAYRRGKVASTTRLLRDGIVDAQLNGGSIVDIGAGIAALSFELLDRGVTSATVVEASKPYLQAARAEASRRQRTSVMTFVHADIVAAGAQVPRADVVTLDRVVCCYPDYHALLGEALARAGNAVALSYPRDRWYVRASLSAENGIRRVTGNAFRTFVHPADEITRLIEAAGFQRVWKKQTLVWVAEVFSR